jgi:hypothetical protein
VIASDSRYVAPQPGLNVSVDQRKAFFGAEDNMKNGADVRVRHRLIVWADLKNMS